MNRMILTLIAMAAVLAAAGAARSETASPMTLAENGRTGYAIVIAREAEVAERQAADELAFFLQ